MDDDREKSQESVGGNSIGLQGICEEMGLSGTIHCKE